MVDAEDVALHLEQIGRVPDVAHELAGHLADRLEGGRVDLLPGLQDRVLLVPGVQRDRAVVGVDRGLDRVADVVDVVDRERRRRDVRVGDRVGQAHARRVRVGRARRVAVHDPDDAAVHDARVRVAVELEVRRDLLHARRRVAVVEDLRVLVDEVREQDLLRLELERIEQLGEAVADLRPAVPGERRLRLARAVLAPRVVDLDRVGPLRGADDGVLRGVLAEVDPRLEVTLLGQEARGGDAALEEDGLAVGRALVARRGDEAVAVRVDRDPVVPVVAVAETRHVEVADGDDRVLLHPVDLVAVDVHVGLELVVAAILLELADRRRDDLRVHDADRCSGLGVGAELPRLGVGLGLESRGLQVGDAVGLLRAVDVPLVVLGLIGVLVRLHLEGGDHPGVADADDERGHDQQRGRREREAPAADDGRDEEEDGHDGGDDREDAEAGDGRVGARVGGTGDPVVRLDEGLVAVQPQARRLHEQVQARDDRELDAGRLRDAQLALADAHGAVEVGHERSDEKAQQQDRRDEREEDRVERHREHVEPGVDIELRVDLTGRDAVGPEPHGLPVAGRREPREEAEEDGHAPHREAAQRLDDLLVAVELRAQPDVDRTQPVGELDDDEQRNRHAEEADDEHHRRRDPLRGEHAGEPDLVEPEEFGVERREDEERRDERGDDHQGDSEDASGGSRRGRGLGWGRGHPSILGTARCGGAVTPVTAGSRPAPAQVAGTSQVGRASTSPSSAMTSSAASDSSRVAVRMTCRPSGTCPTTSSQLASGARK